MFYERESAWSEWIKLLGSLLLCLAGLLVFAQPSLGVYQDASPDFLDWLKPMGAALMGHGLILFVARLLHKSDRKEMAGVSIVFTGIYWILLLQLFRNPGEVPLAAYHEDKFYLMEDFESKSLLVRAALGGIMVFMGLSIFDSLRSLLWKTQRVGR